MQTVRQLDPLRSAVTALKKDGTIALVPTMGALHEGHLALVREARARARHVVVSIFVNPRQFGANEDLDKYPRQLAADCALLEAEGVSLLWAPNSAVMYPPGFATSISVSGMVASIPRKPASPFLPGSARTVASRAFIRCGANIINTKPSPKKTAN